MDIFIFLSFIFTISGWGLWVALHREPRNPGQSDPEGNTLNTGS